MGSPDSFGTSSTKPDKPPDYQPLQGQPPAWVYDGAPLPPDAGTTTVVHHDAIADSITWLQRCKDRVDQLINDIQAIPRGLGNPVLNEDADLPAEIGDTVTPTTNRVPGQLGAPGPTKFGLHPQGQKLALAHINTFNAALAALHQMSASLEKAVEGTSYIAQQYKNVEDANAADVAQIMSNPPYQPGVD
jgi:hypothetical protein